MSLNKSFTDSRRDEASENVELADTIRLLGQARQAIKTPAEFKDDLQRKVAFQ